jgi:hypothetical protein
LNGSLNAQSCSSLDSNLVSDKEQVPSKRDPVLLSEMKTFKNSLELKGRSEKFKN